MNVYRICLHAYVCVHNNIQVIDLEAILELQTFTWNFTKARYLRFFHFAKSYTQATSPNKYFPYSYI